MTKIVLGGGNFKQKGWINVDFPFKKTAYKRDSATIDVRHNLMVGNPMPFDDNSVDAVYTEHCIEHLTYDKAKVTIEEVYRILKPGCPLRISCPDVDILYRMYKDPKVEHIQFSKKMARQPKIVEFVHAIATPIPKRIPTNTIENALSQKCNNDPVTWFNRIENYIRASVCSQARNPGYHLSWWNFDRLKDTMAGAGFRKIHKQKRHSSKLEVFREPYFDNTMPQFSVIVQGAK